MLQTSQVYWHLNKLIPSDTNRTVAHKEGLTNHKTNISGTDFSKTNSTHQAPSKACRPYISWGNGLLLTKRCLQILFLHLKLTEVLTPCHQSRALIRLSAIYLMIWRWTFARSLIRHTSGHEYELNWFQLYCETHIIDWSNDLHVL